MKGEVYPLAGRDDVAPSSAPPLGLLPERVPQLVALGFDDNARAGSADGQNGNDGGVHWALRLVRGLGNPAGGGQAATYDGAPARLSFYLATSFLETAPDPALLARAWRAAFEDGHELGNHTHSHAHGGGFAAARWRDEIAGCTERLGALGLGAELQGFRAPYLEHTDAAFDAVASLGLRYDCSVEDGWQPDMDGTNYRWPYTLDRGCPAAPTITAHAGLWELPAHPVIVPPDDACPRYGVAPGLRARLKAVNVHFDETDGKITGFDYNLWVEYRMTKAEFLATLKYTLDLRLRGNRAPFMLGAHTDCYANDYPDAPRATAAERRAALEEFVAYALDKPEVRLVSLEQVLDWVRNPVPMTVHQN